MIPWLTTQSAFPPATQALRHPNGLLAAGGDLSVSRLLAAYRSGIFPWYSPGEPILWWSPDPRMVLEVHTFQASRSLQKSQRHRGYTVHIDRAFDEVLAACAAPRPTQPGTWLSPDMRAAYGQLHRLGYAHSFETWRGDELVGGLYGVAIGRMFFGESMFSRATDASKVALAALVNELRARHFPLIDCQVHTAHLASLGACEIPRQTFLRAIASLVNCEEPLGRWSAQATDAQTPCNTTHEKAACPD